MRVVIAKDDGEVFASFQSESVTYEEMEDLTKDLPTISVFEDGRVEIDWKEIIGAVRRAIEEEKR